MAGQIEQLSEPQHHRAHHLLDAVDLDGVGADSGSWNRQRGKHQGVAIHQGGIDLGSQRSPHPLCLDVGVGRDISSHLQPFSHAFGVTRSDDCRASSRDKQRLR